MKRQVSSGRSRALWIVGAATIAVGIGVLSVSAAQGMNADHEPSPSETDQQIQKLKNLGADEIDPEQLQNDPDDPNMVPEVTDESPDPVHHQADSVSDGDS